MEMDVMCAGCLSPLMCVAVCGALSGPDGVALPACQCSVWRGM